MLNVLSCDVCRCVLTQLFVFVGTTEEGCREDGSFISSVLSLYEWLTANKGHTCDTDLCIVCRSGARFIYK